jgi:hypothetical protein
VVAHANYAMRLCIVLEALKTLGHHLDIMQVWYRLTSRRRHHIAEQEL